MPSYFSQPRRDKLAPFLPGGGALAALPRDIAFSQDLLDLQSVAQDLYPKKLLELRENGPPPQVEIELVVWPNSTNQVEEVVRWSREAQVSLIPYGAGSGVCGATLPTDVSDRPRVLVDLKKMRAIRSVDPVSQTAWVEVGWIGENLERELNERGYTLGHFPSSIYCSTVGGYLAARSAGQFSTKYGNLGT